MIDLKMRTELAFEHLNVNIKTTVGAILTNWLQLTRSTNMAGQKHSFSLLKKTAFSKCLILTLLSNFIELFCSTIFCHLKDLSILQQHLFLSF